MISNEVEKAVNELKKSLVPVNSNDSARPTTPSASLVHPTNRSIPLSHTGAIPKGSNPAASNRTNPELLTSSTSSSSVSSVSNSTGRNSSMIPTLTPIVAAPGSSLSGSSSPQDVFANEENFPPLTKFIIELTDGKIINTGYNIAASRPEMVVENKVSKAKPIKMKDMKFNDQQHERTYKFSRARKQFGINVKISDIQEYYPYDISNLTKRRIFIEPAGKELRTKAIRNFIASGTGFQPEDIIIDNIFCTIDDSKVIAWVNTTEDMVLELFRGAAIVKKKDFSIFPSIPQGAKLRKKEVEKLIKTFREHDPSLKYQVRNGEDDIKLMLKFQEQNDFQYWTEVDIEEIDAFGVVPELELVTPKADDSTDPLTATPPKDLNES